MEKKKDMDSLFSPRSVAMVGATADSSKIGFRIVRNLLDHGFKGELHLVNPRGGEILGIPTLKGVEELPLGVELAVLSIPKRAIYSAMEGCIKRGVKYAVALTAGFKEIGDEGGKLERALAELVRSSSTRLIGPNCAGLCSTWGNLHGSMEIYPAKGDISFVSQSGSFCSAFSSNMAVRRSGVSKYISIGNKVDVNVADLIDYLGWDPTTKCIALYLEDITDGRTIFERAMRVSLRKPIVVLKSGRTREGARATLSHTGAMAGEDMLVDGAFRQMGLIRVNELSQLYDVAASLSKVGPLGGRKIAILSDAGGPGVLATDAAVSYGLKVPRPSEETQQQLRSFLLDIASVQNPIDMTFTRDVNLYGRCIETLCRDEMDAILVTIPSHFAVKREIVSVLSRIRQKMGVPIAVGWLSADEVEQQRRHLWQEGIPAFLSAERAAYCLSRLAWYGYWLANHRERK